jgi:hypothetical protein
MMAHDCLPSYTGGSRRITVQASLGKNMELYLEIAEAKRAGGMAEVVRGPEFKSP